MPCPAATRRDVGGHPVRQESVELLLARADIPNPIKPSTARSNVRSVAGDEIDQHVPARTRFAKGEGVIEEGHQPWRSIGFVECATPGYVARIPWSYMREEASAQR